MSKPLDSETISRADAFLDKDEQMSRFRELGEGLFAVFGTDRDDRVSTQIRNLQQIVVSARRLADVEDFVKNQMGKEKLDKQNNPGPWRQMGETILMHLKLLRENANSLAPSEDERLLLRLHLARGWVRAVVGAYLYAKAQREMSTHA